MKSFFAAGFALGASAALVPRDQCCFSLTVSGGTSGQVTQLGDGQNRVRNDTTTSQQSTGNVGQYCLSNGQITDGKGRGCILTPPTTQFQCDQGASPSGGFSVNGQGQLEHNGDTTFYACAATGTENNIYTSVSSGQTNCHKITLNTGGKCTGNSGGASSAGSSSALGQSTQSAQKTPSGYGSSWSAQQTPSGYGSSQSAQQSSTAQSSPAGQTTVTKTLPVSTVYQTSPASTVYKTQPASTVYETQSATTVYKTAPASTVYQTQTVTAQASCESQTGYKTSDVYETAPASTVYQTQTVTAQGSCESQTVYKTSPGSTVYKTQTITAQCSGQGQGSAQTQTIYQTSPASTAYQTVTAQSSGNGQQSQGTTPAASSQATAPAASSQATAPAASSQATAPAASSQATAPAASSQATAPAASSQATTPAASSQATKPATSAVQSASGTKGASACQTTLSGAYQTPHLIVPVSSGSPSSSYGTSYFGQVNSTTKTIFNFDIPQSYEGKQCTILFLLPEKQDLSTSNYTLSGTGSLEFSQLSNYATQQTSWDSVPKVESQLGSVSPVRPGNSYIVATQACAAGTTESIEVSSTGDLALNFFEDYNPAALGLFITAC